VIGERTAAEPERRTRDVATAARGLTAPAARQPLYVIQAARGIAALLVVLFHATSIAEFYLHHDFAAGLFIFGYGGVDLFFVVSGFVIMWAHGDEIGRPDRLRPYLVRRVIRIYPVFWIVAAVLLPIYFGVPQAIDRATLLRSLLLLEPLNNPIVGAAWSLPHELFFYAMFGLAIGVSWRFARIVFAIWLSVSAVSYVAAIVTNGRLHLPHGAAFWFSPYNLEFAMGCATAFAIRIGTRVPTYPLAVLGAAIFLFSGLSEPVLHGLFGQRHSIVCYGFASVLLVWSAVRWERQSTGRMPRLLLVLGDASYSIYLTHYALLDLLARASLTTGLASVLRPGLTTALIVAVTLGVGVGFHHRVERPLLTRLRRHVERRATV
jgi:exopolysaccharide production protein ExoZ